MTDRFVPPSVAVLEPFVRAGVLGMVEVHVTATMVESVRSDPSRSGGGSDGAGLPDEVVIAAAQLSMFVGSTKWTLMPSFLNVCVNCVTVPP